MTDALNDPFADHSDVDYVSEVSKKFAGENGELDVTKLARGKYEADKHISTLEAELAEVRKKAELGLSLEDFYKKVREPVNENDGTAIVDQVQTSTSPEDIEKIVRDALTKTESERIYNRNRDIVTEKVNELFGENATKELRRIGAEKGLSLEDLRQIGLKSPTALFSLIGSTTVPSGTSAPTSTVNMFGKETGVRNQKFYQELRKSNPKLYNDPKTQAQEMRDAMKLGEAYFD